MAGGVGEGFGELDSGNLYVSKLYFGNLASRKKSYNLGAAMTTLAGAASLGNLASVIGVRPEQSAMVAALKSGSEEAYASLIAEFHQPIYSLVYRVVGDPSDAADTTQEVFLKVFRGMKHFHEESSLKTWIYRIAIHEASNRRRWWFRHKAQEMPIGEEEGNSECAHGAGVQAILASEAESPFDNVAHEEVRARVEQELRKVSEPYRTTVILRDLEGLSYEEIAEITRVSLGTVKSRITRGRDALRKRLEPFVRAAGKHMGLEVTLDPENRKATGRARLPFEVTP